MKEKPEDVLNKILKKRGYNVTRVDFDLKSGILFLCYEKNNEVSMYG